MAPRKQIGPGQPSRPFARKKVLNVALKLFASNGYRSVTIREISKKAGVNHSVIAYHFGSKFKLYEEIVEDQIESRMKLIDECMCKNCSSKEKIMMRASLISKTCKKERTFYQLIFNILIFENDKKVKDVVAKNYVRPLCENLISILKKGNTKKAYSDITVYEQAHLILSVPLFSFLLSSSFKSFFKKTYTDDQFLTKGDQILQKILGEMLK